MLHHLKEMDPEQQRLAKIALVSVAAAVVTSRFALKVYRRRKADAITEKKLSEVRAKKEELRQQLVSLKTPMDNMDRIVALSFQELQDKINSGEVKIIDALQAYQAKALKVDERLNCISEVISEANDSLTPEQKQGMLHGMPITLKDMMQIKGYDATWGMVRLINNPAPDDCVLAKILKKQGAIPYSLSNMPTLGFAIDTANFVFGETVNPYSVKHTSGGSSGGEGALVGGGGSPLGFGTDLGGSIRVPSNYCGLCGFKPTAGRLSLAGVMFPFDLVSSMMWVVGPMAHDVYTCATAMKALLIDEMFQLDSSIPPMPFKNDVYESKRPLRIGYYETFHLTIEAVPSVRRGVRKAKAALEAMGHTLVPFVPPEQDMAGWGLAMRSIFDDNGHAMVRALRGERIHPNFALTYWGFSMSYFSKWLLHKLLWPFGCSMSFILKSLTGSCSADESWAHQRRINAYIQQFNEAWDNAGLDGCIGPVTPYPAPELGKTKYVFGSIGYTMMYNALNVPAGTVPVTKVSREDIQTLDTMVEQKKYPNDAVHRIVHDMHKGSEGLPIGVQCIAKRWQDELCLRIMRDVEEGLTKVE